MQNKNYAGIDYFRILAAWMVVAIHIAPFAVWNPTLDVLLTYSLFRIAVPFFLMTTGFFVLGPYIQSGLRKTNRFSSYLKHNLWLYLTATILYLPISWYAGNLPHNVKEFLKALCFDGTFYHLWYFPAAIIGCWIVVLLVRISMRAACIYSVAAYIVGLAGDSYYGLISSVPFLKEFYDVLFSFSSYTRNGFFFTPIFLFLGLAIATPQNRCSKFAYKWGLAIFVPILLLEGYWIDFLHLQRHNSMYLSLPLVMYFLFQMLLQVRGQAPYYLRKTSTLLYLVHPAVIVLVRGLAKFTGLTQIFVDNSMILYGSVCFLSTACSAGILFYLGRRNVKCAKREGPGSS